MPCIWIIMFGIISSLFENSSNEIKIVLQIIIFIAALSINIIIHLIGLIYFYIYYGFIELSIMTYSIGFLPIIMIIVLCFCIFLFILCLTRIFVKTFF